MSNLLVKPGVLKTAVPGSETEVWCRPEGGPAMKATLSEVFVYNVSLTIRDHDVCFHGFASPIPALAILLARETRAPNLIYVAGATYGVNPHPPFLSPTSSDWVMDRDCEARLGTGEFFDLAARGDLSRMFFSGAQIDRYGSLNVTMFGEPGRLKTKLPGGGGGCNLSATAGNYTIWTTRHRAEERNGRKLFRFVERLDFVTTVGRRSARGESRGELGLSGGGPDRVVTELGVFDFDPVTDTLRLVHLYPNTTVEEIQANTGFEVIIPPQVTEAPLPGPRELSLIRRLDPLRVHEREFRERDRQRVFEPAK